MAQKVATAFPYHPILARLMRSDAVPALLLSYAYAYAKTQADPLGEMMFTKRFLAAETGVSRYKVERARARLVEFTLVRAGQAEWVWRESVRPSGKLKRLHIYVCINVPVIDYLLEKYYS